MFVVVVVVVVVKICLSRFFLVLEQHMFHLRYRRSPPSTPPRSTLIRLRCPRSPWNCGVTRHRLLPRSVTGICLGLGGGDGGRIYRGAAPTLAHLPRAEVGSISRFWRMSEKKYYRWGLRLLLLSSSNGRVLLFFPMLLTHHLRVIIATNLCVPQFVIRLRSFLRPPETAVPHRAHHVSSAL